MTYPTREETGVTRLCFIDTETTSLRPDRRAWEIAVIVRTPGEPDAEYAWLVHTMDLDLGNADQASLRIGRFYDRHPEMTRTDVAWGAGPVFEEYALTELERLTRGAHLVGAVPNFDAEVLGARMRAHGICPAWHYHLVDVEALAVGYLRTQGYELSALPWSSDELTRMLGLEPVSEEDRHTALGDARWARAIWDRVMGGAA